jgi:YfiH family protein
MSEPVLRANWPAPQNIVAGTVTRCGSDDDLPATAHYLVQVHGTRAVVLGSADFADGSPQADAVIGNQPGDLCVVKTADCLPLLLCSHDGQEIAAVHAGWRGLAAGVIEQTLADMRTPPDKLMAWFGPAISQPAFEVGGEVRESFGALGLSDELFQQNERGRWQADLFGLARARLQKSGVSGLYGGGVCTYSNPEQFFSYRRDGETGRLLNFVYRR